MQSNATNTNSNRIYSISERQDSSTAIISQKYRARKESSKLRPADHVERNDHAKREGEVLEEVFNATHSMKVMGVNSLCTTRRQATGDELCQPHTSTSMKPFRRGVALVQIVHWVCQPDASSQGIRTHAEPLTGEVMWVAMSC